MKKEMSGRCAIGERDDGEEQSKQIHVSRWESSKAEAEREDISSLSGGLVFARCVGGRWWRWRLLIFCCLRFLLIKGLCYLFPLCFNPLSRPHNLGLYVEAATTSARLSFRRRWRISSKKVLVILDHGEVSQW